MSDAPSPSSAKRTIRVLYLNPFSQQVSGPDESLLALLSGLIPLGVEAHVVLPRPGPHVPRYQALGASVHYAPLTFVKRRLSFAESVTLLPRLIRGTIAVYRIARRERVHLIHTNMEVVLDGSFAALLLRLPHVLHYRGNTLDRPKVVFDVLARFWAATTSRIFCISNATAEIFRKRGLGAGVDVVYNPVDLGAFTRARRSESVRASLGAGPNELLAGTVCRIHPRKDVATFLRAVAVASRKTPNLRGVIIGTAETPDELAYRATLEDLARSLGIDDRVHWAGTRRDMPDVLKAMDVFVLSSRNEGFGRVVAEATAAGVPMVLSREGALPEVAGKNELAVFADAESSEAFAAGIVRLLAGRGTREPTRGDADVSEFAIDRIAASVLSRYEASLSQ